MARCEKCGASGLMMKLNRLGLCPACAEERLFFLESFYAQYKEIPNANEYLNQTRKDADEYASRIRRDADEYTSRIRREVAEYADATRVTADAYDARMREEADKYASLKAREVEVMVSTATDAADERKRAAEFTASMVLADLSEKIAVLLDDASHDFHFKARSAAAALYDKQTSEKKTAKLATPADREEKPSSSAKGANLISITPSQFKRSAAKNGFVAFDFETTGLSAGRDRIVEVGAIVIENGQEVQRLSTLVNPEMSIPAEASRINHITDDMVASAPYIDKVLPQFIELVGTRPMIAYNAPFDVSFLIAALKRSKLSFTASYADALSMARKAYDLNNYRLGTVAEHLGIRINDQHRSIGDCEALYKVVLCIMQKEAGAAASA